MKKLLILSLSIAVLMCGCNNRQVNGDDSVTPSPIVSTEPTIVPSPTPGNSDNKNITFEDQKEVEELLKSYYKALEKKDFEAAFECLSKKNMPPGTKVSDIEFEQFKSLKLISIEGYISILDGGVLKVFKATKDTPTVCFQVTLELEVEPEKGYNWENGENVQFVVAARDSDGKWRIDHFATSP